MKPTVPSPAKGSARLRRWARAIHRDLSYFFAGVVMIYAVSGILLNHKRDFNSSYTIRRTELRLPGSWPQSAEMTRERAEEYLHKADPGARYAKHYASSEERVKIFVAKGSTMEVDVRTGDAVYEKLTRRPLFGSLNRLHYNPNRWWTRFSDLFAGALLVITITGLIMVPGRNGLRGRGGLELAAGIAIPILFLLFL